MIWKYALENYRIRISYRGVKCSQLNNPFDRPLHFADTITNLSRVSRQTNREARLLPFTLGNEFDFGSRESVAFFCKKVSQEQRNAITRVRTRECRRILKSRRDWTGMQQAGRGILHVFREMKGVGRVTLEVMTSDTPSYGAARYGILGTMAFGERDKETGDRGKRIEVRMVMDHGGYGSYLD